MKIMGELQDDIQLLFDSSCEEDIVVDFFNDEIMSACLHTTVNSCPTIEDMNIKYGA